MCSLMKIDKKINSEIGTSLNLASKRVRPFFHWLSDEGVIPIDHVEETSTNLEL